MRAVWVIINVVFWTILLATIGILLSLFEWRGRIMGLIARLWSKIILWSSHVSYSVKGLDQLDKKGHYVFASNHESAFDILLAYAVLPYQLVSIAKIELKKYPIFGWAMSMGKHIFVDRGNHEKALASLKLARESLLKNPRSILLFPEGTRSVDGKIHRFKRGGLGLAINTSMPVVPMAMCGTSKVVMKGSWQFTLVPIELRIGEPIITKDLTLQDRNRFVEQVRDSIITLKSEWENELN